MENIKGILVTLIAPMENHIANGGEKLLGNASSIKKRNDGRVYVSGQMQRHVLFSAINRLNLEHIQNNKEVDIKKKNDKGEEQAAKGSYNEQFISGDIPLKNTYVSNGDGIGNALEVDLRADMGGFMHPSAGNYSGRRTAPLTVTPAVAMKESAITRDLMIRLQRNVKGEKVYSDGYVVRQSGEAEDPNKQALATKEQSDSDIMLMSFFLDITNLSISKKFSYNGGFHVNTEFVKHVSEDERKRRVKLFLEATRSMVDYANEARNAVTGEPQKVLIVFDTKMSRKACRYFDSTQLEQNNIIAELKNRSVCHWLGDDTVGSNQERNVFTVDEAYKKALEEFANSTLFDPAGGNENIQTFGQAFPQPASTENASSAHVDNTEIADE